MFVCGTVAAVGVADSVTAAEGCTLADCLTEVAAAAFVVAAVWNVRLVVERGVVFFCVGPGRVLAEDPLQGGDGTGGYDATCGDTKHEPINS